MRKIILSIIMCCVISMSFAQRATVYMKDGNVKKVRAKSVLDGYLVTKQGRIEIDMISYLGFFIWDSEYKRLYSLYNDNGINLIFKNVPLIDKNIFSEQNYKFSFDDIDYALYPETKNIKETVFKDVPVASDDDDLYAFVDQNPEISVKSMAALQGTQLNEQMIQQLEKFSKARDTGKVFQLLGYSSTAIAVAFTAYINAPLIIVGGSILFITGWILDATATRHIRARNFDISK